MLKGRSEQHVKLEAMIVLQFRLGNNVRLGCGRTMRWQSRMGGGESQ